MKCAKVAYENFNTTVNDVSESSLTYGNTLSEYARMDNILASSRLAIGWSSNLAMLSLTYYWTELSKGEQADKCKLKEYYDIFVILAILAQVAIDSSKRLYVVNAQEEVIRIQNLPCMQYVRYEMDANGKKKKYKYDLPKFMKYVREPSPTKDGNYLPYEILKKSKDKLNRRINPDFICPMNWLIECLDRTRIKHAKMSLTVPIGEYFIKEPKKANNKQMSKIRSLIDEYNIYTRSIPESNYDDETLKGVMRKTEELIAEVNGIKMGKMTVNRLVGTALEIDDINNVNKKYQGVNKKYRRKLLTIIHKTNREYFLSCFKQCDNS